jgi:hypothetical protein
MPRELRATRYLTKANEALARFIVNDLRYLDYDETLDWYAHIVPKLDLSGRALLGCNDRYFLTTGLLRRTDALHPWLFARWREVENDPDGYIDLWARGHYKSTCITYSGCIQEIVINPEIKIAIFSAVKPVAHEFLQQIKTEFETNEHLKAVYHDVLYENPKTKGPDGRPAKWSLVRGITVKRRGNPKEATIEAHGLIDGQPTSRHYDLHDYDDVVTQDYLAEDQMKKTTERLQMADNLGTKHGARKWMPGTRYHFADSYGVALEQGWLKPRIYPATEDGTATGDPVFLTPERWAKIKNDQRKTYPAQMLLNPVAETEATFRGEHLRGYDVIPNVMNVYILVDPSKGRTQRSDRTAMLVVGIDVGGNKYLLDGVCHRMRVSERIRYLNAFRARWKDWPGVQGLYVGYEQYGQQSDIEVIEDDMDRRHDHYVIEELNTPQRGGHGKDDRIERLEPDIRRGVFYLPAIVWHPDRGGRDGMALWRPWTQDNAKAVEAELKERRQSGAKVPDLSQHAVGHIIYYPMGKQGLTKAQKAMEFMEQRHRIVRPLKRRDETNVVYDLTRHIIDELIRHPFAQHDDGIDAMSRIYDMNPRPPVRYEESATLPLPVDGYAGAGGSDADFDA